MDRQTKTLIFGREVREKIVRGVEVVEKAVGTTLGSRGRNVALEQNWGAPIVLHDGVSVARQVILKNPYENMGAQLTIAAAQKTNDQAGDGTTTATILTYAIVKEAMSIVTAGTNPMIVRKGIEKAVEAVTAEMKKMAIPVKGFDDLVSIATISCADPDIGKMIATAIQKVGEEGIVTVQEGNKNYIEVEYKEGMDFARGFISPYFVTNPEKLEAVVETGSKEKPPFIVIVNETLKSADIISIVQKIVDVDKAAKIVFIADDYDNEAIGLLVINRVRNKMPLFAVKSPDFGEHRSNLLNDIATITGGHVISSTKGGIPMDQITAETFGRADKIIITKEQTLIVGGKGSKKDIEDRIKSIDKQLAEEKNPGTVDKLIGRKAKLVGGVAVISVGAPSETEMREKKERIYDAVNATKAAIQEGIIPGGGVSLIHARKAILNLKLDEKVMRGARIVHDALAYPIRRLLENVGGVDPGFIIGKVEESVSKSYGYNVDTEAFEDLIKTGIVDPVKVPRCALVNAASVATMMITTDCMIAFEREEKTDKKESDDGIGEWDD